MYIGIYNIFLKRKVFGYRTRAINNRGFYYFFILSQVGLSLMIGGIPLKLLIIVGLSYKSGYYQRAVINGTSTVTILSGVRRQIQRLFITYWRSLWFLMKLVETCIGTYV